ncbi:MAG: trigger factor [Anaerolineae bacterium]|nr:trigger factor [Anaerolineae bacterium]
MKVTTERQENCVFQLDIAVEPAEENAYLRRSARTLSREYRIPGFRPGKAPYDVIVQRLGIDTVRAQVVDQFGDEIFEQGLAESGLEPIDQASLQDVTWEPLTLHLSVPVGPEVALGDYRAIRVHWGVPEVTEDQVNAELLELQKGQSEWRPDNRPAALGDQVVLNVKGTVEGELVLENTDREIILDADSPYPVPGFAAAVVGMMPGEMREFELAYPDHHYNAEIAGKTGHFEVSLNEIRVEVLPELDDEFAALVGDYENLEQLKSSVRSSLEEKVLEQAEAEYEEQIWEKLGETASVEYPLVMVDRELEAIKRQLEQRLEQQNIDLESYFRLTNTTEEDWQTEVRPQAEQRLRRGLILAEVIQTGKLALEPVEVATEIERLLEEFGDQGERFREMLESPAGTMSITERLLTEKAIARLKSIARGQEPPIEPSEPAEQTPAEETPAEQTPAEETPAEQTPAEETPAEQTPAEQTPVEETPAEQTPAEEAPAEQTPAEQTPVEETPAGVRTEDE